MPLIKKFIISIAILTGILYTIGYFLPSKWSVKRSIEINQSSEKIFPYINDLHKWSQWYPWTREMDVSMVITYDGAETGAGAIRKWSGSSIKSGEIKITKSIPNEGVWYSFKSDQTKIVVYGSITIAKKGNTNIVTWEDTGDNGYSLLARFFSGGLDKVIGQKFETGLENLKRTAEESKR
ncbi:MAG: SRPBCC family protein [Spirochaetia bacterium]|nr:SRPBCC family protein [Spirochaetia bacterium]